MSEFPERLILDTSVTTKWFATERESHVGEAWALLGDHLAGSRLIAAPAHMRLELLNALKSRGFDEDGLLTAALRLEQARLEWYPVDAGLAHAAASIAARHRLTLYDAAFAALAVRLDAELVTADVRLAESGACRVRVLG